MSNPSKQKGTAWESVVTEYLRVNGFPYAERRTLAGRSDRGDIAGIPGVMIECKAEQKLDLARYMKEVAVEKLNAKAQVGVAVCKRRHHGVDRAYVVLELKDFIELIR